MKRLTDLNVAGKRILVRCDFNVPQDGNGAILDDFRIQKSLPTIRYLVEQKAKVILISHLGDPEGPDPAFRLDTVKDRLEQLLRLPVGKTQDCVGREAQDSVARLQDGEVLLLENVRFHPEEKANDPEFANQLAHLGELYVNDAFSNCHRAHASMVGIPALLPSAAGFLLIQEIEQLARVCNHPEHPLVVLIGGRKVETKAKFINHISAIADAVLVNGLIQKEISEKHLVFSHPEKIFGPHESLDAFDITAEQAEEFAQKIMRAKTVVWNGPFGKFEDPAHRAGTQRLARAIIESGAFSVTGGGETIEFLRQEGMIDQFSHVSTGGGAMLDFLSGDELPGIKALR
jgi:3-phosphoglycerate kinase